jgi:hypothetical protein
MKCLRFHLKNPQALGCWNQQDCVSFGLNDSANSVVAVNYLMINGPIGEGNPQIQGVNS